MRLHDSLLSTSTVTFGTNGTGTQSSYQAPFDDFTPTVNAHLRVIEWQGYYCNRAFVGSDIPTPVATQFVIRIAPDDGGAGRPPFAALRTTESSGETHVVVIPASAVRQQLDYTRLDSPCGSRPGGDPAAFYGFTTELATPIAVTAGRRYWISILAVMPNVPVSWHWRFGRTDSGGGSIFCLCNDALGGATLTTFPNNRAFALWDR